VDDAGFAPQLFNAPAALASLQRDLRALGLTERSGMFERRGRAITKVALDGHTLQASVVKRPSRSSPEWTHKALKSGADIRDFVADMKKKIAGWSDRDD